MCLKVIDVVWRFGSDEDSRLDYMTQRCLAFNWLEASEWKWDIADHDCCDQLVAKLSDESFPQ